MSFFSRYYASIALLAAIPGIYVPAVQAQSPLDETVSALEQWVETEKDIASTEAQWEADKAAMEQLIRLYRDEIEMLDEQISSAQNDVSAAELKREELTGRDDALKAMEAKVLDGIIAAEKSMIALEKRLPPPLVEELSPLFNSLPDNPEESSLSIGQRIQPLVAILTQVQKFNGVVTVVDSFREYEAGRTVQTRTVYFGLGAAYYVDNAREHAGYAVITEEGWTWEEEPSLIPVVAEFIDVYSGQKMATYLNLPVEVK